MINRPIIRNPTIGKENLIKPASLVISELWGNELVMRLVVVVFVMEVGSVGSEVGGVGSTITSNTCTANNPFSSKDSRKYVPKSREGIDIVVLNFPRLSVVIVPNNMSANEIVTNELEL